MHTCASQGVFSPGRTASGGSVDSTATPRGSSRAHLTAEDSYSDGGLLSPDSTAAASPSPTNRNRRAAIREPTEHEAMLARVMATELRRYSTLLDAMLDGVRRLDAAVKVPTPQPQPLPTHPNPDPEP